MEPGHIDSYRFGRIVIDNQSYTKDIILLPDSVIPNWWRKTGHKLHIDDLRAVFEAHPTTLIVGQGSISRMNIPLETRQALKDAGIALIALPTGEACQRYNDLRKEGNVAAALHLTC